MSTASPPRTGRDGLNGALAPVPRGGGGNPLGSVVQILAILLLLAMVVSVMVVLLLVASLVNAPGQVAGGIGNQLGAVATQARGAASGVQQAVENATDPNHPPSGLMYDTEFSSFDVWQVGGALPQGSRHMATFQSIQRRENAPSADTTLYAIIHVELRQPNQVRLFGQVVRSDSEAHDYAVYKGETFRIAGMYYRVNWISQQSNAMAAGAYRNPDSVSASLKFEYD